MNRSLHRTLPLTLCLSLTVPAVAQNLTQFQNGQVADANAVNANFNNLRSAVQDAQATADQAQAAADQAQAAANGAQSAANTASSAVAGLTSAITVSSQKVSLDRRIQFASSSIPRKVVLFEAADNDHQFFGFGTSNFLLRYQVSDANQSHVFYAGASPTSSTELMRIQGDGKVGIGRVPDASPFRRLTVDGRAAFFQSNGSTPVGRVEIGIPGGVPGIFARSPNDTEFQIRFANDGVLIGADPNFMIINPLGSGSLSIPWGTAIKAGGGSWSSFSDARLKRDIEPLSGALDRLLQLEGHTFFYKDPTKTGTAPGKQIGFVAQEVETVFPDWVHEDSDGMKLLSITGFEALAVESLRELKHDNDRLTAENVALKVDNDALHARLDALEQAVAELQPLLAGKK